MTLAERRAAWAERRVNRRLKDAKFFITHLEIYLSAFDKFIKGLFVLNGASLVACFSVFGNVWRERVYAEIISRLIYYCLSGLFVAVLSYPLVVVFTLHARETKSIADREGYGENILQKWKNAKTALIGLFVLIMASFACFVIGANNAASELKTAVTLPVGVAH